jgi:hypothetical protein
MALKKDSPQKERVVMSLTAISVALAYFGHQTGRASIKGTQEYKYFLPVLSIRKDFIFGLGSGSGSDFSDAVSDPSVMVPFCSI